MILDEIKESFSLLDVLDQDGHTLRRSGRVWKCRCMFHDEKTGSFTVFPDNRFKCFGCGAAGSVIDYIMRRDGLEFPQAVEKLGGSLSSRTARRKRRNQAEVKPARPTPTPEHLDTKTALSSALLADEALQSAIAADRCWKLSTIRSLAVTGVLGWDHASREIAFIYESGVKLRRWQAGKGREFRWREGGSVGLWRCELLQPGHRTVIINEGETDAITAIDAGIESADIRVLALPSVSTFPRWAMEMLAGRNVLLVLDGDKAGTEYTGKYMQAVRRYAKTVTALNWEEVRKCL